MSHNYFTLLHPKTSRRRLRENGLDSLSSISRISNGNHFTFSGRTLLAIAPEIPPSPVLALCWNYHLSSYWTDLGKIAKVYRFLLITILIYWLRRYQLWEIWLRWLILENNWKFRRAFNLFILFKTYFIHYYIVFVNFFFV